MTNFLTLVRNKIPGFEGETDWLYLDNRRVNGTPAPLVTIGNGCAVGRDEALTLPFQLQGKAATRDLIGAQYDALEGAPFGRVATFYKSFTDIRLTPQGIQDLLTKRLTAFTYGLRNMFPAFDSYPETAKAGILELAYGVGLAGLQKYPLFRAAVTRKDWKEAAAQCASNASDPAYNARNQNRKLWFLEALNG